MALREAVLRHQLEQDAFPVFMVSGKRTHDAKEIFDGVPSLHDAKAAAIIARLQARSLGICHACGACRGI